jgi:hypothetical protein
MEFGAKHELMNKQPRASKPANGIIRLPGYPFDARRLLSDLRDLLARTSGRRMYYEELGRLMGKSKSTAHFWFDIHRNQNLLGFMALLEHLTPRQRRHFIDWHCRVNPTLRHPRLAHAKSNGTKLSRLLNHDPGLTIITGGTDPMRTFVFTALGNACPVTHEGKPASTGIDIHRPRTFVPLLSLKYIDETLTRDRIRQLVLNVWPRVLTSGNLLLCNGVWSSVPETRADILRVTKLRHVILAEKWNPDIERMANLARTPVHIVEVSPEGTNSGLIRLEFHISGKDASTS